MDQSKNKQVDDILSSLDNTPRAAAPDFFFTRLHARMEKTLLTPEKKSWQLKPVYILGSLVVILAVNAFVLFNRASQSNDATADNNESIQSLASEYRLNDNNTVYNDLNQDK